MLGFGALVMTASAVEVGSRKKEKAKIPRVRKDTVGMLYKTWDRKLGVMRISRDRTVAAW